MKATDTTGTATQESPIELVTEIAEEIVEDVAAEGGDNDEASSSAQVTLPASLLHHRDLLFN